MRFNRPNEWANYSIFPLAAFANLQIVIYIAFPLIITALLGDLSPTSSNNDNNVAFLVFLCTTTVSVAGLFMSGFYGQVAVVYGHEFVMSCALLGQTIFAGTMLGCVWCKMQQIGTFLVYRNCIALGSLCCGLLGSRNTMIMSIFSVAAKFSTFEKRTHIFGCLDAALYTASIGAPIVVTLVLHSTAGNSALYGAKYILLAALLIGISGIISIWFCIPQSNTCVQSVGSHFECQLEPDISELTEQRDSRDKTGNCGNYGSCQSVDLNSQVELEQLPSIISSRDSTGCNFDPTLTFTQTAQLMGGSLSQLAVFPVVAPALAFFIFHACTSGDYAVRIIFLRVSIGLSQNAIDMYTAVSGFLYIVSITIIPTVTSTIYLWLSRRWKKSNDQETFPDDSHFRLIADDVHWAAAAMTCRSVYSFLFGRVNCSLQAIVLLPMLLYCGPAVPRLRTIISKSLPAHVQGQAFVGIASLETIAELLAPLFALVFMGHHDHSEHNDPSGPIRCYTFISVGCMLAVVVLLVSYYRYVSSSAIL